MRVLLVISFISICTGLFSQDGGVFKEFSGKHHGIKHYVVLKNDSTFFQNYNRTCRHCPRHTDTGTWIIVGDTLILTLDQETKTKWGIEEGERLLQYQLKSKKIVSIPKLKGEGNPLRSPFSLKLVN